LLTGEFRQRCGFHRLRLCFNPHPSLLTGEFPVATLPTPTANGFNPHPSLLTGEFERDALHADADLTFQSTPVIADG